MAECPLLSLGNSVIAIQPNWNGRSLLVECIKDKCAWWKEEDCAFTAFVIIAKMLREVKK